MKEEIKAGILIGASLLILTVSVVLIGGGRFLEKIDSYNVKVMNAVGLETGSQVRLGGVRVGSVLDIKGPSGPGMPVTVIVGIKGGTPIYKGTKAVISQIGFVGDIYLLLRIDKTTNEKIRVGDEIPAEEAADFARIMSQLDGLSQSLDGLIKDVNTLFSRKNVERIERLVDNTDKAIVSGSANIGKVATALRSSTEKLESVLNEIEGLVKDNKGEFAALVKKAREDLEKAGIMIESIEKSAKSVDRASLSAERAIDLQSANIDVLLNRMIRTTEDLQDAIQDLGRKPWSVIYKEQRDE